MAQDLLPEGATLVPIICFSDETHLTNFSGDKKIWPIYMTIGNIRSATRNKPSNLAVVLLGLLPISPAKGTLNRADDATYKKLKGEALHKALAQIFRPLQAAAKDGVALQCPDLEVRLCFPRLAAWIADYPEYTKLFNVSHQSCPVCTVPKVQLGSPSSNSEPRDYSTYRKQFLIAASNTASPADREKARDELGAANIKCAYNAFWDIPGSPPPHLHCPDLLHGVYLGLLKHLMEWIDGFIKKHSRQRTFDTVWASLPPYPGFTRPGKAYRQVSQWHGKEMRNFGRVILVALAATLSSPSTAEKQLFSQALQCTRALVDFHLMAQYNSHTEATLQYMETYFDEFHQYKDVFLEYRASKAVHKESEKAVQQLRSEQVEENRQAESQQASTRPRNRQIRAAEERLERNTVRMDTLREHSDFNFIKMHLPQHYKSHVKRLGALPAFSTEVGETSHKFQMKEPYRLTNRQNYERQIIAQYTRQTTIGMRIKNASQWADDGRFNRTVLDAWGLYEPTSKNALCSLASH